MAAVNSLGVHTPVALPYLLTEGLLPPDPKPDQYQWDTYIVADGNDCVEEELLVTQNAVAWSQGRFVRNIYRFDLEGESMVQALLTSFPAASDMQPGIFTAHANELRPQRSSLNSSGFQEETETKRQSFKSKFPRRALVVLLKTKAHIYFLRGAHHIVDLPFEVERAFAAPRGIILQRKRTVQSSLPPTPQVPAAPPNSFFSSQGRGPSFLRQSVSPTLVKSFARTSFIHNKPTQPSPLGGNPKLNTLFQEVIGASGKRGDEDVTNIYSLSGPLSELGVVTYSIQHQRPQKSTRSRNALSVEFEGLDPAEKIIHVSAKSELSGSKADNTGPLSLLVSFNHDISIVTVWHAWYVEDKSLKTLLKLRADQKAAKARRRSSFLTANVGTGATTPAVRRRDGARESFVAPNHPVGELAGSQGTTLSRNQSKQQQEEVMASQMDPDYQPAGSQQPARENRRISSMNTDVRASQTTVSASFGGGGGRRTTSFGGPNTRRSLSHRKSRGSTPGSAYGQSLGGDESMDLDSTLEFDSEETTDEILQHIRATIERSGVDNVFDSSEEGFKRELIVRKIHSFPAGLPTPSQNSNHEASTNYKVVTLLEPRGAQASQEQSLAIYLHDRTDGELQYMQLKIKQRLLWPELPASPCAAIPLLVDQRRLDRCEDILKIHDGEAEAILLGGRGIQLGLDQRSLCPLPSNASYRFHDPLSVLSAETSEHKDVGKNRTLERPLTPIRLQHAGPSARFDETGIDGVKHRRRLQLQPADPQVEKLLAVCEVLLPRSQSQIVRKLWCQSYAWLKANVGILQGTSSSVEFVAFVATIFTFAIDLLDAKARAAPNISKMATGKGNTQSTSALQLQATTHAMALERSSVWSWLPPQRPTSIRNSPRGSDSRKDQLVVVAASLADELSTSLKTDALRPADLINVAAKLMLGLHLCHEEQKLSVLSKMETSKLDIAPVVAQIGTWLNLKHWAYGKGKYYELEGATDGRWAYVKSTVASPPRLEFFDQPVSVFQWFEHSLKHGSSERYPSFSSIAEMDGTNSYGLDTLENTVTPRLLALSDMVSATRGVTTSPVTTVECLAERGFTVEMLDTYPEAISAPFKDAIARCEKEPPTIWKDDLLQLVGRDDLSTSAREALSSAPKLQWLLYGASRDVAAVIHVLDHPGLQLKTREAGRHAISQLIFSEDRRLVEAMSLMHFNSVQVAQCPKQPDWDEATHFEHQRRLMHWVTIRMIALPAGDGMIHYDSQTPLLTEKYHLPGFNSSCVMQPMGHTLTTDRSGLTEEKVNWAYFHAGVSAGMRISRNVKGIDTSWIAFNKPNELTNRHAGMLLALGLGGHLRNLAKWLSFKYLTPKHTMTSVGLLLGLSASYLGTMDGLITRMLSVHITRMLPPGAAELNVSPATQTAGLMGIGLLYYNTQHRRMSEIMLSEIEYMEMEDPDSGPDMLRDESYRLAAGFALGLINLGKGNDLRGLHGMYLPERLLAVAVGPRPVNAVHVFDRATAGAVVAVALVYMKSGDRAVANKIDIPDTEAQYDHVRPDILMLRAMAKHIILWDNIEAQGIVSGRPGWIHANLPNFYKSKLVDASNQVTMKNTMNSAHIPLFNVFTGLAWALGLKYAGSGNVLARDEILGVLKAFYAFGWSESYYFDAKLGRSALKRCMDALALCAAVVMAGTGDLETFRYLRRMHGRTDSDTTYGSHLAAHLAIGVLFLGGGTFSLGTSNLAIASLICAFYPLFPTDVQDNRVHLQAFRHLWVFAAEARCIIIEDIDTQRPIHMPIKVTKRDGTEVSMRAPCLLPELDTIATIQTDNPAYWRVTLDFANNPEHLKAFREDQRVFVRRCPAAEAHSSAFSAALAALNDAQTATVLNPQIWHTLFNLHAFKEVDRADVELLLPPDVHSSVYSDDRATVVDDRMVLSKAVRGNDRNALWNLRVLFAWAERARREGDGKVRWLGEEVIEGLRASVEERARRSSA
ncbi:hypothetical protein M409DRAFT_23462 [Zasmidium cellare ATCC 36951]|uniref:Uncharacterized protein n=1 Tax=Zasmidium cellare ATCC 36951 TaxID=1080233 RepID=A0A6A6CJB7_ZASCE|nr:uncharacterized protein M409DRAFT_23462 [Zasmidium cellare ATCC 36951]KAF2166270.1 hypothetical protein M409DRAFT_23462 [Zasmidium cellare ATCC 36951]